MFITPAEIYIDLSVWVSTITQYSTISNASKLHWQEVKYKYDAVASHTNFEPGGLSTDLCPLEVMFTTPTEIYVDLSVWVSTITQYSTISNENIICTYAPGVPPIRAPTSMPTPTPASTNAAPSGTPAPTDCPPSCFTWVKESATKVFITFCPLNNDDDDAPLTASPATKPLLVVA